MFESTSLLVGDSSPTPDFTRNPITSNRTSKRSPRSNGDRPFRCNDPIGQYLSQIDQPDLLDREQERKLGKKIWLFRKAFQRLVLKEPAVVEHIVSWLLKYKAKQIRLDMLFEVPLKDKVLRKQIEPKIRPHTNELRRLIGRMRKPDVSPTDLRTYWRNAVRLCEELKIRPKFFESSPFKSAKAKQLLSAYQNTCRQLASANCRLVVSIARQYCKDPLQQMELIQEGNRGLMRAVTKFDFHRDLRFSTYATPWIRKAILETLPNQNRMIRIPDQFRSTNHRFQQAIHSGNATSTPGSTEQQMSDCLEITYSDASWRLSIQRDTQSLNQATDDANENQQFAFLLVDHRTVRPDEAAEAKELRSQIEELLSSLTPREQSVIRCRFGLDDGSYRSLAEVGKRIGFSRERVRQLEKSALGKLEELAQEIE